MGLHAHPASDIPIRPEERLPLLLEELDSDRFRQCSRYSIINMDYIDKIDTVNRYIKLRGIKEQIEIGQSYKKRFLRDVVQE